MTNTDRRVEAAGGLVFDGSERLAVVHRPQRDDWSLPKGHLEAGETHEQAALREVLEETGLTCRLIGPGGTTEYLDGKGRRKRVVYFEMEVDSGTFAPNDEVDELAWIGVEERSLLSYGVDSELVRAAFARRAEGSGNDGPQREE